MNKAPLTELIANKEKIKRQIVIVKKISGSFICIPPDSLNLEYYGCEVVCVCIIGVLVLELTMFFKKAI